MYFYLLLIISPISIYSQNSIVFQEAQSAFNKKQYSTGIDKGLLGIKESLHHISQETVALLPYIKVATITNVNYFIDLHNKNALFHLEADYTIVSQGDIKISLQYSFEAVRYYYTYIKESKNYTFNGVDYEIINLGNESSFLWNRTENTAYYIHTFDHQQYKKLTGIPGLLLQISLTTPQQLQRKEIIISDLINKINWNKLQTMFKSF